MKYFIQMKTYTFIGRKLLQLKFIENFMLLGKKTKSQLSFLRRKETFFVKLLTLKNALTGQFNKVLKVEYF